MRLRACVCVAMLGVFPRRKTRLEVAGIGTHRKTERARAAGSAEFACFARRAIVSAPSRASARLNRRQIENGLLLSPVMIFPRRWFARRFRELTGEFFFVRSARTGRAGATARKSAGRKSPVPKHQVIDLIGYSSLQKILAKNASLARRSAGILPAWNGTLALKSVRLRETCAGPKESARRKNPVPKCQVLERVGYFGVKNFLANTASLARRSAGILPAWKETFALKLICLREANASLRQMRARTPAVHKHRRMFSHPTARKCAGRKSPVPKDQGIGLTGCFDVKIFSRKRMRPGAEHKGEIAMTNSDFDPYPPRAGEASRARQRA